MPAMHGGVHRSVHCCVLQAYFFKLESTVRCRSKVRTWSVRERGRLAERGVCCGRGTRSRDGCQRGRAALILDTTKNLCAQGNIRGNNFGLDATSRDPPKSMRTRFLVGLITRDFSHGKSTVVRRSARGCVRGRRKVQFAAEVPNGRACILKHITRIGGGYNKKSKVRRERVCLGCVGERVERPDMLVRAQRSEDGARGVGCGSLRKSAARWRR